MNLCKKISALFLLALFTVTPVNDTLGADLNNLINIQKKFAESIRPQFETYFQELSELERSKAAKKDGTGLVEVQNEIKRVEAQLDSLTTLINYQLVPEIVPEPQPVTKTEPVVAPALKNQPITHVSSTKGIAGSPNFSKNNIYSFNLPTAGKNSNLTFYATGRRSTETEGVVWLIKPDGKKEKVTKWKARNFTKAAKEVKSYEKLDPITVDLSDLIETPGQYKVEFEWTGGVDPLVIFRVELTS